MAKCDYCDVTNNGSPFHCKVIFILEASLLLTIMGTNLSQTPALEPPPGFSIVSNLFDPVLIAPICLVVIAVTLPLTAIFIALGVHVRQSVAHAVGADDSS